MALGIFATNLTDSRKTTAAGRYLRDFRPELNNRYRVFLPQFQFEGLDGKMAEQMATLTVAARQFSYKDLGVFSYVYDSDELEIHDDDSFTDLTELRSIERLAQVLHTSLFNAEVASAEKRAREEAQEAGVEINQDALAKGREKIEEKFYGNKDTHKTAEVKPIVGRAEKYTYTIGVFIPMTVQGVPEWEKATVGIWQLTATRQDALAALYKAEAYKFSGNPFIEFSFDYKGDTKQEAGRKAKYEFITPDLSLATKFENDWKIYGQPLVEKLPTGTPQEMANSIIARCGALHNRNSVSDILSKFYAHVSTMQTAVVALKKLDDDYLKKNKKYINMIPTLSNYPAIKAHIDSIVDETEEDDVPAATETKTEPKTPAETQVKIDVTNEDATAKGGVTFGGLNPNAAATSDDDDAVLFGDI